MEPVWMVADGVASVAASGVASGMIGSYEMPSIPDPFHAADPWAVAARGSPLANEQTPFFAENESCYQGS
eukprot:11215572-Lingulodinium_polyedra.AAC.1